MQMRFGVRPRGLQERRSDSCLKANVVVLALADRRSVPLQLVHRV